MGNRNKKNNIRPSRPQAKPPSTTGNQIENAKAQSPGKPQRHHFIPRWVLSEFRTSEGLTSKPRQGTVTCYYPETGELTTLPISTAYSSEDLYKDSSNPQDLSGYGIEQKLSVLEGYAAKSVRLILDAVRNTSKIPAPFPMKRQHLGTLRKFMFIMHYRSRYVSSTYFDENHPGNSKSRAWIQAYRKRHNLPASEVWLHVMRYYLDTSHNDLILHGKTAEHKMVLAAMADLTRCQKIFAGLADLEIDASNDGWRAVAYSGQMANYYLAIWEAAPGYEFIISSNSFGIWEGALPQLDGALHRFYVVSPRIALVLCDVVLKPGSSLPLLTGGCGSSMVSDVPHVPPTVSYAKTGTLGERDLFQYEIQRLTGEQTNMVNAIVLAHVETTGEGMITFSSKEAMLKTLAGYRENPFFRGQNQLKYSALCRKLLESRVEVVTDPGKFEAEERYKTGAAPGQLWEFHLHIFNILHRTGHTDPRAARYLETEAHVLEAMEKVFADWFIPGTAPRVTPVRPARLVRKMDDDVANRSFRGMSGMIFVLGQFDGIDFFMEQHVIAVYNWLLHNNRRCFDDLEDMDRPAYEPWFCDYKEYTDLHYPESSKVIRDLHEASYLPASGKLYRIAEDLYNLIQESPDTMKHDFNLHLGVAVATLRTHLDSSELPISIRNIPVTDSVTCPATLNLDMGDEQALSVFAYVRYMLKSCGLQIRELSVFKEQIVIGVLKWMLNNRRGVLDQLAICLQLHDGGEIVRLYFEDHVHGVENEVEKKVESGGKEFENVFRPQDGTDDSSAQGEVGAVEDGSEPEDGEKGLSGSIPISAPNAAAAVGPTACGQLFMFCIIPLGLVIALLLAGSELVQGNIG